MRNSLQARGSHLGGKGSLYNGFFHLQPDSRQALRCPEGTYTVPLCILPCSYMQDKALHSFILVDLIYSSVGVMINDDRFALSIRLRRE